MTGTVCGVSMNLSADMLKWLGKNTGMVYGIRVEWVWFYQYVVHWVWFWGDQVNWVWFWGER